MAKRNVTYPDFETEVNIKMDKIWKDAEYKGLSHKDTLEEYQKEIDRIIRKVLDKSPDINTRDRLIDLIESYVGDYDYLEVKMDELRDNTITHAEKIKDYYDSDDFESMYLDVLHEDLINYGAERIKEHLKYYGFDEQYDPEMIEKIHDYLIDNMEEYVDRFKNYYTGGDDVASVSFGEQEEEVPENALLEALDYAGFYVDKKGQYMYYDMSDEGIYVNVTEKDYEDIIKEVGKE